MFKVCKEMIREITLFLPISEAINSLNHSLTLLDKSKDQIEPQDLGGGHKDFSTEVKTITQKFLS